MKYARFFGNIAFGLSLLFFIVLILCLPRYSFAASAEEININVDATFKQFKLMVPGGSEFLWKSKGILAFPSVIKAGFFVGVEYGEGALRVDGSTVGYYSTAAGSIGLQLGAQSKSVVLVFLQGKALHDFH